MTGVIYTDMRNGEEYEQPAGIVVLSSYVFGNTQHLLLAGIGEPYDRGDRQGRRRQELRLSVRGRRRRLLRGQGDEPVHRRARQVVCIDDFNGENFDHGGLGFFGGGYFACGSGGAPPIDGRATPHGTPRWGSEWKQATVKWYHHYTRFNTQGSVYANRDNYLDLDPTYKDALGRPLIRLTYNGTDNDHKMSRYLVEKLEGIIKAMNPTHYEMHPRPKNFTIVPYQSTHNTGGTMMGTRSEVERGQSLPAGLGRAQSVRPGRVGVPAAARLQPDRHGRGAGLLVGAGDHDPVREEPRTAGARVKSDSVTARRSVCLGSPTIAHRRRRRARQAGLQGLRGLPHRAAGCARAEPQGRGRPQVGGARRFPLFGADAARQPGLDEANLHDYIADPQAKVKGNRMPYGGLTNPTDVDDVIAYLATLK